MEQLHAYDRNVGCSNERFWAFLLPDKLRVETVKTLNPSIIPNPKALNPKAPKP